MLTRKLTYTELEKVDYGTDPRYRTVIQKEEEKYRDNKGKYLALLPFTVLKACLWSLYCFARGCVMCLIVAFHLFRKIVGCFLFAPFDAVKELLIGEFDGISFRGAAGFSGIMSALVFLRIIKPTSGMPWQAMMDALRSSFSAMFSFSPLLAALLSGTFCAGLILLVVFYGALNNSFIAGFTLFVYICLATAYPKSRMKAFFIMQTSAVTVRAEDLAKFVTFNVRNAVLMLVPFVNIVTYDFIKYASLRGSGKLLNKRIPV